MKKITFIAVLTLLLLSTFVVNGDTSVQSPAAFTLKLNEKATIANYLNMRIKLEKIEINSVTNYVSNEGVVKSVEINVVTDGGCGSGADSRCLGMPAFENVFTISENSSVSALGLRITATSILRDSATFSVVVSDTANTPPVYPSPKPGTVGAICTQEAKQCPDGSYISRTGPNCEFASCQSISYGNDILDFTYPPGFNLSEGQELVSTEKVDANGDVASYYKVKVKEQARLFFIFPVSLETTYSVSSETGASVVLSRPWWNFLAW